MGNLLPKIVHEWNGHLEIFSYCPQIKENSRQYLLLRTDILQKTVVGCPALRQYDNYGLVFKLFYLPKINHHHNVSLITVLEQSQF